MSQENANMHAPDATDEKPIPPPLAPVVQRPPASGKSHSPAACTPVRREATSAGEDSLSSTECGSETQYLNSLPSPPRRVAAVPDDISLYRAAMTAYGNEVDNSERNERRMQEIQSTFHIKHAKRIVEFAQLRQQRLVRGVYCQNGLYPHIDEVRATDLDLDIFRTVGRDEAQSKIRMSSEPDIELYAIECMATANMKIQSIVQLVENTADVCKSMSEYRVENSTLEAARAYRLAVDVMANQFRVVDAEIAEEFRRYKILVSAITYLRHYYDGVDSHKTPAPAVQRRRARKEVEEESEADEEADEEVEATSDDE